MAFFVPYVIPIDRKGRLLLRVLEFYNVILFFFLGGGDGIATDKLRCIGEYSFDSQLV